LATDIGPIGTRKPSTPSISSPLTAARTRIACSGSAAWKSSRCAFWLPIRKARSPSSKTASSSRPGPDATTRRFGPATAAPDGRSAWVVDRALGAAAAGVRYGLSRRNECSANGVPRGPPRGSAGSGVHSRRQTAQAKSAPRARSRISIGSS
jgi:hypothetical protein